MRRTILLLSLLLLPASRLCAQVVVDAAGLVPRIGEVREVSMESTDRPLSALGLALGEAGGPQVVDLSDEPDLPGRLTLTQSVLSPNAAPDHELYPEADYVLFLQGSSPDLADTWYFVESTPGGERVVGARGGPGPDDPLSSLYGSDDGNSLAGYEDLYPLAFGRAFGPLEIPLDLDMGEVQMAGSMVLQGAVDAWGTVVVPAGRFEALRLHQWGVAHFTFGGAGADTLRLTEWIDTYGWMAPGVGQVAGVQELRLDFPPEMGVPTSFVAQVMRLESYQPGPTAVAFTTWGRIKAGR